MNLDNIDVVLTAEAARILSVTPAAVRAMDRRGLIHPSRTESGVRLFDRAEIERLAESRKAPVVTPRLGAELQQLEPREQQDTCLSFVPSGGEGVDRR